MDSLQIQASKTIVSIGDTLTLVCNLVGNIGASLSSQMVWKKNGVIVNNNQNINRNGLSVLIQNTNDAGFYECLLGKVSNGTTIIVKGIAIIN